MVRLVRDRRLVAGDLGKNGTLEAWSMSADDGADVVENYVREALAGMGRGWGRSSRPNRAPSGSEVRRALSEVMMPNQDLENEIIDEGRYDWMSFPFITQRIRVLP